MGSFFRLRRTFDDAKDPCLCVCRRGLRSVDISCLPLRTCALVFLLFESDFGLKECASPIELRSLLVRVSD